MGLRLCLLLVLGTVPALGSEWNAGRETQGNQIVSAELEGSSGGMGEGILEGTHLGFLLWCNKIHGVSAVLGRRFDLQPGTVS